MKIRNATEKDVSDLLDIYRPYVETSVISFEREVPTQEDFLRRIQTAQSRWAWLVAEQGDSILGYAYGTAHRARESYKYSVETSAYVREDRHRGGVASQLYASLFHRLAEQGHQSAYAGITLPNPASVAFHERRGFRPIGIFPKVGRKFGQWHDVAWYYRPVTDITEGH